METDEVVLGEDGLPPPPPVPPLDGIDDGLPGPSGASGSKPKLEDGPQQLPQVDNLAAVHHGVSGTSHLCAVSAACVPSLSAPGESHNVHCGSAWLCVVCLRAMWCSCRVLFDTPTPHHTLCRTFKGLSSTASPKSLKGHGKPRSSLRTTCTCQLPSCACSASTRLQVSHGYTRVPTGRCGLAWKDTPVRMRHHGPWGSRAQREQAVGQPR